MESRTVDVDGEQVVFFVRWVGGMASGGAVPEGGGRHLRGRSERREPKEADLGPTDRDLADYHDDELRGRWGRAWA